MKELLLPALNLGALLCIMFYFLRQPVKAFIATRHHTVRQDLARAKEMLEQAKARHREFSQKLLAFESEARGLRQQALADAQEVRNRISGEARKLSERIVQDANATAQGIFGDLKARIYTQFGTQVLDRAEKLIHDRLTGDDRARIRKEFSRQVEAVQ